MHYCVTQHTYRKLCISYLNIYRAPLAVLTIQRRFQRGSDGETRTLWASKWIRGNPQPVKGGRTLQAEWLVTANARNRVKTVQTRGQRCSNYQQRAIGDVEERGLRIKSERYLG